MISAAIRNALTPRSGEPPRSVAIEPVLASTGRIGAITLVDVSAIDIQAVASGLGYSTRRSNEVVTCAVSGCSMKGADLLLALGVGAMAQETGVVWISETWLDGRRRLSSRKCEYLMRKDGATWKASSQPSCRNG